MPNIWTRKQPASFKSLVFNPSHGFDLFPIWGVEAVRILRQPPEEGQCGSANHVLTLLTKGGRGVSQMLTIAEIICDNPSIPTPLISETPFVLQRQSPEKKHGQQQPGSCPAGQEGVGSVGQLVRKIKEKACSGK